MPSSLERLPGEASRRSADLIPLSQRVYEASSLLSRQVCSVAHRGRRSPGKRVNAARGSRGKLKQR